MNISINEPQAVSNPVTRNAIFIVATLAQGNEHLAAVRAWCEDVAGLVRSVGTRLPASGLSCVCGFGSDAWDRLFGQPRPKHLHPFKAIGSGDRIAVSTPGDLLLHIRADEMDMCFELATQLISKLGDAVTVIDEVHGFRYFDQRAIIGFVDGTENPTGREAEDYTVIGDEDQPFAGGSYVLVQKYLHDMDAWNALTVEQQEKVIGRTKFANIELDDDVKPTNSHSSLTTVEENGRELKIIRDNMPFGRPGMGEFGTYFVGYARMPSIIETMLENMFVGRPAGNYDRLLDFSHAVTGTLFFVPSATLLESLASYEQAETASAQGSSV
ncbi:MAG TPA: Dyp-type peroxidase [Advenella sp.]|nr:Dyp-type peroxidase [Advenella sp.]